MTGPRAPDAYMPMMSTGDAKSGTVHISVIAGWVGIERVEPKEGCPNSIITDHISLTLDNAEQFFSEGLKACGAARKHMELMERMGCSPEEIANPYHKVDVFQPPAPDGASAGCNPDLCG